MNLESDQIIIDAVTTHCDDLLIGIDDIQVNLSDTSAEAVESLIRSAYSFVLQSHDRAWMDSDRLGTSVHMDTRIPLDEGQIVGFVEFLFPNLSENDRHWLIICRTFRQALEEFVVSPGVSACFETQAAYETISHDCREAFQQMVDCIQESPFLKTLTPIQRIVLKREFLVTTCPESPLKLEQGEALLDG